jgi:hypothetical protein
MSLVEQQSWRGFTGVRVARSLVLCRGLNFIVCPFSFGYCIVCPSSFGYCIVCPSSFGYCIVCPSLIYGFDIFTLF